MNIPYSDNISNVSTIIIKVAVTKKTFLEYQIYALLLFFFFKICLSSIMFTPLNNYISLE